MKAHWKKRAVAAAAALCVAMLAILCVALAQRFLSDEAVHRAGLTDDEGTWGMVLIDIQDEQAASFYHVDELGVYVLVVEEKSQAYLAGVRSGDRIVSVNGEQMTRCADVTELSRALPTQSLLTIQLSRGPDSEAVTIELNVIADAEV